MAERVSGGRKLVRTAVTAVLALGVGGCALKGGQNVSSIEGKTLFIKNCASCHTLARANAKGLIGPNLDVAFAESLSQGLGRNIIGGVVEQQIEYPNTSGRMPKLPLTTRQAADIAAYVQYAAARPGTDAGLLGRVGVAQFGPPATEKKGKLAFAANCPDAAPVPWIRLLPAMLSREMRGWMRFRPRPRSDRVQFAAHCWISPRWSLLPGCWQSRSINRCHDRHSRTVRSC